MEAISIYPRSQRITGPSGKFYSSFERGFEVAKSWVGAQLRADLLLSQKDRSRR